MQQFLKSEGLKYLAIDSRVKDFNSFSDKVTRKNYQAPFEENEDFVGIRIIVYYPDEIDRIVEIIDREFDVQNSENKSQPLEVDRFGYRSFHKIIKVPEEWTSTPNYRNLGSYKCEIQIRTILMHAWAEIEHQLQYKNEASVPTELKRKLFMLSAKLEEADEQFQGLRDQASTYRKNLSKQFTNKSGKEDEIELNTDTLQLYLQTRYPNRKSGSTDDYALLIEQLANMKINLVGALDKRLNELEYHAIEYERTHEGGSIFFIDTGMVSNALDVYGRRKTEYN